MSLKSVIQDVLMTIFSLSYPGFHQSNLYFAMCSNAESPQTCINTHFSDYTFYQSYVANCSHSPLFEECRATIALSRSQKIISISFKGSRDPESFLSHNHMLTHFMPMMEMEGFKNTYVGNDYLVGFSKLWNAGLGDSLRELNYQYCDYRIIMRSHSIGGCLSQIALLRVKQLYPEWSISLFAAGCPRCGSQIFASHVDQAARRAVRSNWENDFMTTIPTRGRTLNGTSISYHHCCTATHSRRLLFGFLTDTKECEYSEDTGCTKGSSKSSHYSAWYTNLEQYSKLYCGFKAIFSWEDRRSSLNF